MNTTISCPNLEDLAAVADGVASPEIRERVLRHSAHCEDCYETLVDTLRYTALTEETLAAVAARPADERSGEDVRDRLEENGNGSSWRRYLPPALAAGLLVALMIPLLTQNLRQAAEFPTLASLEAALQMQSATEDLVAEIRDSLDRGRGFAPVPDSRRIAFLMGVRLIDLEVARIAGDRVRQDRSLREMERALRTVPSLTVQVRMVEGVKERALIGLSPLDGSNLEAVFARISEEYFFLGKWAESGRLAAATGRNSFLVAPEFRQGLELTKSMALPGPASLEVERIVDLVETGIENPEKWTALNKAFSDLIGLMV